MFCLRFPVLLGVLFAERVSGLGDRRSSKELCCVCNQERVCGQASDFLVFCKVCFQENMASSKCEQCSSTFHLVCAARISGDQELRFVV